MTACLGGSASVLFVVFVIVNLLCPLSGCKAEDPGYCTYRGPEVDPDCPPCADDSACGVKGVCLPSGTCAQPESILHVTTTGSKAPDCGAIGNECDLSRALVNVTDSRNIIRLDDAGPHSVPMTESIPVYTTLTIDARGADGKGAIVRRHADSFEHVFVVWNGTFTFLGGTIDGDRRGADGIQCATNTIINIHGTSIINNGEAAIDSWGCIVNVHDAILDNNAAKGIRDDLGIHIASINAFESGSLTLSRSRISRTRGGGVAVHGNTRFTIVGNVFVGNGHPESTIGAIEIITSESFDNRLEFNTLIANQSRSGSGADLRCDAGNFVARNNIIWGSSMGSRVIGSCRHAYSVTPPGAISSAIDGGSNLDLDPQLVDPQADPHLRATSPLRGKADPAADLSGLAAIDIDGDERRRPADIGADQLTLRMSP